MADKGCNLFDKSVARCVYMFPQEEEYTSSSWGDSKMYTSGTIANSHMMLNKINESDVRTKIRNWVENDTFKH